MGDAARVAEAEECQRKAEKYLKTSLIGLKFKPDYDSAASEYERAAVCYKNASRKADCRDMYLKAASCYENNGIMFHTAKCKESAAIVCKDMNEMDRAKQLMEEAAQTYAEQGTAESAVSALSKAAKFFEESDPDKAVDIYRKAYHAVAETDKTRQMSEFANRISKLCVRMEKYEEAIKSISTEIDIYRDEEQGAGKVGQLVTGKILCYLKLGDSVSADKALMDVERVPGFGRTEDARTLPHLIESYEKGDKQKWEQCISMSHMKYLDNDYLRLIRKIELPVKQSEDGEDDEEEDFR